MNIQDTEALQRLWDRFSREQMAAIPPEERRAFEQQFQDRFTELLQSGAAEPKGSDGFLDLLGFGAKGAVPFEDMMYPHLEPDFDDDIVPTQVHAAADLYFIKCYEDAKVFKVVDVLLRLFQAGRMRGTRGPGMNQLYRLQKWNVLRYSPRDRQIAYGRAFNAGNAPMPPGAVVNRNFHRQFVTFLTSVAQYFRDLQVGEVIRSGGNLDHRAFASVATVQRHGLDLRYALDRSTYGNIYALTMETANYLKQVMTLLDAPDIKKAFDANTKWNVVEIVSQRYLGGMADISQQAKMAESGRHILKFVADQEFKTGTDPLLFQSEMRAIGQHAEAWLAAYRTTRGTRTRAGAPRDVGEMFGLSRHRADAMALADI
jgi:hypothetical protein